MTRTVFDNAECAHVWAQNAQETGRSGNGNFYFHGPALFSYGSHFLAGFIMPDGVALLNADSYSISTSRHQSYARRAVSHRVTHSVPSLSELGAALAYVARAQGETRSSGVRGWCHDMAAARRQVRAWAVDVLGGTRGRAPEYIGDSALAYVLGAVGLGRSLAKVKREAAARIAKREAAELAERERQAENLARLWGGPERAAALPGDLARIIGGEIPNGFGYGAAPLDVLGQLNREALRAQKWAKGRPGFARIHARIRKARALVRQAIDKREAVESRRVAWATFKRGAPMLREALAILGGGAAPDGGNVAGQVRDHARRVADLGTLDAGAVLAACAQVEAMRALVKVEAAPTMTRALRAALEALRRDLAPLASKGAADLAADLEAAQAVREAARLEKEREKREAWQRGESVGYAYFRTARGGAYLRAVGVERDESGQVTGGTLETSQGARVPLAHALRVFRFLKWCRETGTPWARNGRTIRVGFYQVDSVEADGTFRAGCHLIEWPQVEALAHALGVADLAPDSTVAQAHAAA